MAYNLFIQPPSRSSTQSKSTDTDSGAELPIPDESDFVAHPPSNNLDPSLQPTRPGTPENYYPAPPWGSWNGYFNPPVEWARKLRISKLKKSRKCAEKIWKEEERRIKKWKDEINYLLLFAGLFATILTGFVVPYYVISESRTCNIVTDVLWFTSLAFTLAVASIGISVCQWLDYVVDRGVTPTQDSVKLWLFRQDSLTKWRISLIISVLPLFLQLAVHLFLIGLVVLLWSLNPIVAGMVTGLVALLVLATIFTVMIPVIIIDCPYKTPLSLYFLKLGHLLTTVLDVLPLHTGMPWPNLSSFNWTDHELDYLKTQPNYEQDMDQVAALTEAYDPSIGSPRAFFRDPDWQFVAERAIEGFQSAANSPMPNALQDGHHLRVLEDLDRLLQTMPSRADTANKVYNDIISLLASTNISMQVRDKTEALIKTYAAKFSVDFGSILPMLLPSLDVVRVDDSKVQELSRNLDFTTTLARMSPPDIRPSVLLAIGERARLSNFSDRDPIQNENFAIPGNAAPLRHSEIEA